MNTSTRMKTRFFTTLLCLSCLTQALAFHNPATGRWLSRDPQQERGGMHLYAAVNNNHIENYDAFGLQCCVLQYPGVNFWDHIAIQCDNGTYISAFPSGIDILNSSPVQWRTKEADEARYGPPAKKTCIPCLDETRISLWFYNYQGSQPIFCGRDNNCSDIGRQAIISGLLEQKPDCSCGYQSVDVLSPIGFSTSTTFTSQTEALIKNNCNRWRCEPFSRIPRPVIY